MSIPVIATRIALPFRAEERIAMKFVQEPIEILDEHPARNFGKVQDGQEELGEIVAGEVRDLERFFVLFSAMNRAFLRRRKPCFHLRAFVDGFREDDDFFVVQCKKIDEHAGQRAYAQWLEFHWSFPFVFDHVRDRPSRRIRGGDRFQRFDFFVGQVHVDFGRSERETKAKFFKSGR